MLIGLFSRRTNTESSANDDSDYEIDRAMRSHDNSKLSNDCISLFKTMIQHSLPCSINEAFKIKNFSPVF